MDIGPITLLLTSYIIGSIPFGLLFSKAFKGRDIRNIGSGNIGTANVIRTVGIIPGLLTFLCDFSKGLLPVILGTKFFDNNIGLASGFLAVLGHIFSLFLKFKGGKGVATAFGVMSGLNPLTAALSFGVFIIVLFLSRISSISSLVATVSNLIFNVLIQFDKGILILNILLLLLIFYRHLGNIDRLLRGEEPIMWGKNRGHKML